jgi:xanthine/uracil permease
MLAATDSLVECRDPVKRDAVNDDWRDAAVSEEAGDKVVVTSVDRHHGLGRRGVEMRPDVLSSLPSEVQLLAGSGLIAGGVTALVLNVVLPVDEATGAHAAAVSADGGQE